ncbi:MAG: GcvT family protein [Verrucomicrobiales bacterium]|nr:GcvT family protein [Verrucomicrobiales bacterium]
MAPPPQPPPTDGTPPPASVRTLILGGGIAGLSVAYHLGQLGWKDTLVLEQNRLAGGTTWHAAGMVTRLRTSSSMMRINQYSADLYRNLTRESGVDTGWREVGSLVLARTADRWIQIQRTTAMASLLGVECHAISPAQAAERFPLLRTEDLVGAAWIPHDGRCHPESVVLALAAAARASGVRILEHCRATALLTEGSRVVGAMTPAGPVRAECVVLAGGMWSRQLVEPLGITLPLHPVEHHYVVSTPIPGAHGGLPCTRDYDGSIYLRGEDPDSLVFGAFQRTTKVWDVDRVPDDFSFQLLPPDWPKFEEPLRQARWRIPALDDCRDARFVNGPESFTPDNQWLMGETPELAGLFVLAGFNSAGIASAGGAGKCLAEWIVEGHPSLDLTSVDLRRFGPWANSRAFLRARVTESLGLHYEMAWPNREFETAREVRRSALHARLAAAGACFGVKGGWERPNWFALPAAAPLPGLPPAATSPVTNYSFGRQNWFTNQAHEHRAAREHVALFDQSGFAKIEVTGPDATSLLQRVCANRVDVAPGRLVYTAMLNRRGGFESDLTVLRVAADAFYLVTGSAQGYRDLHWLRHQLLPGEYVTIRDVTEDYGVLGVMGPASRQLLAETAGADLSHAAFPFGTAGTLRLAGFEVRALRMTYVGELGWELHAPVAALPALYDALRSRRVGTTSAPPVNAGHYAIQSLRLEKGYRAFGSELSPDETPLEAGLTFAVDESKPFLGREALLMRRTQPLRKRLVSLVLTDPDPLLWGGEPVLREGVTVGQTTSAAYGHTLGASVALAYVRGPDGAGTPDEFLRTGHYEVLLHGARHPARLHLQAPYDPRRARILS